MVQGTFCAGVTVIGEVNAWTSNVMNLIWLIGTFTFAVVLAVVTEDIVATVLVSQTLHHVLLLKYHNTLPTVAMQPMSCLSHPDPHVVKDPSHLTRVTGAIAKAEQAGEGH